MPILRILRALFHAIRAFVILSVVHVLAVIVVRLAKAGMRAYCIVRDVCKKHIYVTKVRRSCLAYSILLNSLYTGTPKRYLLQHLHEASPARPPPTKSILSN